MQPTTAIVFRSSPYPILLHLRPVGARRNRVAAHNWRLIHFDGGAPEGPTINSGNALGRFSGPEQALITDFRNSRAAFLDNIGPFPSTKPIPPNAATDILIMSVQDVSDKINVLANDHDAMPTIHKRIGPKSKGEPPEASCPGLCPTAPSPIKTETT